MTSPSRPAAMRLTALRLIALLLATALLAACTSGPQSQAIESQGPSEAPASEAPASDSPASAAPPAETPSEAIAPEPTAQPAPLAIPPKPAKVTWKELGSKALAGGQVRESYRITWSSPEDTASTFSVYGVTECLRESKKNNGKPCVVKGMKIPKSALKLIAQVPGSARSVDIAWKTGEAGPGPYAAVLIRASNSAGDSIFTIAWSAAVCWRCTY
ncbi:MAG TPA: hypothetical protein VES19_12045 [Candidatus Limnocylindrales bacterium]|nr:hypothetical protein [Candidatus Limnocylindrales bacterium]